MASLRAQIEELLAKYEPEVQRAFLDAMDDLRTGVDLAAVTRALENGDLDAALDALNLDGAALNNLQTVIATVYAQAGQQAVKELPMIRSEGGQRIHFRFDVRNPTAEAWLREQSSSRITGPVGSIEAIREAIRPVLEQRLSEGQNPRETGLDVVGRINRVTGQREGGLIGLSAPQIDVVEKVRVGLLSKDPEAVREAMRHYLTLGRKDGRIAKSIEKLLDDGKKPNREGVEKLLRHLKNSYLLLRGEIIGRTETLKALNAARHEAFVQSLAKTNYGPHQVIKTWQSAGDGRVRHTHAGLNGQKVMGLETSFASPGGAMMQYPGDTSFGAPASEVIGCRCICSYRIDVFGRGIE